MLALALTLTVLTQAGAGSKAGSPAGHWTTARPLPEALVDAHAAVLDGKIYVAGGLDAHGQPTAHVHRYDPATDLWERVADLPAPRHNMPLAVFGDMLYAIGGLSGTGFRAEQTMWAYNAGKNEWKSRAGLPAPRGASAAVAVGKKVVVFGGIRRYDDGGMAAAPAIYDPTFDSWVEVWPMPTPRDHLTAETVNGLVYVIGGRLLSPAKNSDVLEIYDPAKYLGGRWLRKTPMPTARGALGSAVLDKRIHVFGGETAANVFATHEVYDPENDQWTEAPPLPTARHGIAVAAVDGKIYVMGGGPQAGLTASDIVEVYTP
jgi:N-acetylneuraminic acid mutarotase